MLKPNFKLRSTEICHLENLNQFKRTGKCNVLFKN